MTNPDYIQLTIEGWNMRVRKASGHAPGPVLLALHGLTGDDHSMDVFTTQISGRYSVLSLRAPFIAQSGFSWTFRKRESLPVYQDFLYSVTEIVRRMPGWFAKLEINPAQIDLLGFSQGAALSLCLVNEHPSIFTKTAALAGFLPRPELDNPFIGHVSGKDFFVAHGRLDETIPIQAARSLVELLEKAGAKVTYCEEEIGHRLAAACFTGLKNFFSDPGQAQTVPGTHQSQPEQ